MVPASSLQQLATTLQAEGKLGPGRNFWVYNGGLTGANPPYGGTVGADTGNRDGTSPLEPWSTIDYAVGRCTANRGDNILVLPGHVETFNAAAGVTMDVAGVTLWGLGRGLGRPQLNIGDAAVAGTDINVTAANCRIHNFFFELTATDGVDRFLNLAAADLLLSGCYFRLQDGDGQVNIGVEVATGADRCTIEDCVFFGNTAGAAGDTAITVSAAVSQFTMRRCIVDMIGGVSPGCVEFTAAALNCHFEDCFFANRVNSATTTIDCNNHAVTGQMIRCMHLIGTIAATGVGILPVESTGAAAFIGGFESYVVNDQGGGASAGEAGALIGTASA